EYMTGHGNEIKSAFKFDYVYRNRLTPMPNYSQAKLTSKLLNFQNLSNFNSSFIPSAQSSRDSASQNFSMSDNIDYCDNSNNN
ncbi:43744_t:CDS:2, partial [Gigaspora margarita]